MTDTPDIVEVMARAIYDLSGGDLTWDRCPDALHNEWRNDVRAALKALSDAGFVVVPVEPTEEMLNSSGSWFDGALCHYRAMIAAAQKVAP